MLFRLVREFVAEGTSVVYITHRLAEVRELADRVTVLRDGRLRATAVVDEISDRELLALIVGRQLDSTFPPKHAGPADEAPTWPPDRGRTGRAGWRARRCGGLGSPWCGGATSGARDRPPRPGRGRRRAVRGATERRR